MRKKAGEPEPERVRVTDAMRSKQSSRTMPLFVYTDWGRGSYSSQETALSRAIHAPQPSAPGSSLLLRGVKQGVNELPCWAWGRNWTLAALRLLTVLGLYAQALILESGTLTMGRTYVV